MKRRREWRGWRVELASLILPKGWHARRARLTPAVRAAAIAATAASVVAADEGPALPVEP